MKSSSGAGHNVTGIQLQVVTSQKLADRIGREVRLPGPPPKPISNAQLKELLKLLRKSARRATKLLRENETMAVTREYREEQQFRVLVTVMSGPRVLGRIDGLGRVFDARGKQVMGKQDNVFAGFGNDPGDPFAV